MSLRWRQLSLEESTTPKIIFFEGNDFMVIRIHCIVDVEASKWENESQKQDYMKNAEDVIQLGLVKATVPDWKATVTDIEEV